jgi:hypothetical protein
MQDVMCKNKKMTDYRFCISLRITHPSIDPAEISNALGFEAFRSWKVGQNRTAPNGKPLEGKSKESFWAGKLHEQKRLYSNETCIEDYISLQNKKLMSHSLYFKNLVDTGGYVEYFVGWFSADNVGLTLEPKLMKETASLNIAIGLDVYVSEEQNT